MDYYLYVVISHATAYWISHLALKTVYDHEDGLNQSPHDITAVKEIIVNKFQVRNNSAKIFRHIGLFIHCFLT